MKRPLLLIPVVALLAVSCNSSQQATVQTPSQNTQPTTNSNDSASSPASSVDSTQSNNTSGLKTYVNARYNFSMQYPATWIASEQSSLYTAVFRPKDGQDIQVSVQVVQRISDKQDIPNVSLLKAPHTTTDGERVTINGIIWTKWVVDNNQAVYSTARNNMDYVVEFATAGSYFSQNSQILASFKFTK